MKLKIDIPKNKLLQILVPEDMRKFEIVNYGFAGTYLMESDSKKLNAWKIKLPNNKYEIIGRIKDVVIYDDNLSDIEPDKNFILRII